MSKKYALFFPGIGYHTDKPLLYYGKKLASSLGYEIIEIPYSGFESGIFGSREKMIRAFKLALSQTREILKDRILDPEDHILIFSKSIGTVVAAAWQKEMNLPARNIYFTPLADTFSFTRKASGIVFHGSHDPWAQTQQIKEGCLKYDLPFYLKEGANHSMETGDVKEDLETMGWVMGLCEEYIRE